MDALSRREDGQMVSLRQRYFDDLRLKNFSPKTIKVYVHAVSRFARHFDKSPEQLAGEEIRAYMVHLIDKGLKHSSCVIMRNEFATSMRVPWAVLNAWFPFHGPSRNGDCR
jgi:hypothetical protein